MFNVGAVVESMRRHWIAIVVIFALALGAGAASSFLKTGSEAQEISDKAYTAEASVYVTLEAVDGSMISEASDRLISDARRTVISDKVAGEIRRTYGNEVSVYSPWWLDEEKNARYYSHYIFVDVSAPTQEIALAATNDAAKLAAEVMATTLPVKSVAVAEEAYLKQGDGSQAADRGVDALEEIESAAVTSSAISVKKLVIFGFVGLFGAIFVFACVDILSRRIRSARDVERMLDLPVLGVIKGEEDYAGALAAADVLLNRNNLNSLAVAGICQADGAAAMAAKAADYLDKPVTCIDALSEGSAVSNLAACEAVVLVISAGAASASQIDEALRALRIADVPVAGAVFVPKGK